VRIEGAYLLPSPEVPPHLARLDSFFFELYKASLSGGKNSSSHGGPSAIPDENDAETIPVRHIQGNDTNVSGSTRVGIKKRHERTINFDLESDRPQRICG